VFFPENRVKLQVLLFASWADALRSSSIELDVNDGATAAELLLMLEARAGSTSALPRPAVAVNRKMASSSTRLTSGDEVAIIPPVSGG
jgi:molybdopterin converting factor small subunit